MCVCHETQTLQLISNPTPKTFQNVLCSPSHCPCLPLTPGNTKELREQERLKRKYKKEFKDMLFLAQEMSDVKKSCVSTAQIGSVLYPQGGTRTHSSFCNRCESGYTGEFVCFKKNIFTRAFFNAVCFAS